jgi:hypothetical protein
MEPVLLDDSLSEVYLDGRFTLRVVREAGSEVEKELLGQAERLLPSPEEIVEATETWMAQRVGSRGVWPEAFQEAAEAPGERWWWREWDEFLLPYSLTGATVEHYLDRIRSLAAIPNPFRREGETVPDHRASFLYEASTRSSGTGDVIVDMRVDLSFWCGRLCAIRLSHVRVVTFGPGGELISVEGDGPPNYIVS